MSTRLYFPFTTAAPVTPLVNGLWLDVTESVDRKLQRAKTGGGTAGFGTLVGPWVLSPARDRRYVSNPLEAQTISGTVKLYAIAREGANNDNATDQLEIYVVSNDGLTVRGTLLAMGQHGSGSEYTSNPAGSSHAFADGDALTSLAVQAGDRLVIVVGHTATGITPEAQVLWGDTVGGTDLPENESSTSGVVWVEFSGDLIFQDVTFAGAVQGQGTLAGIVQVTHPLAGEVQGQSTFSAPLSALRPLSGAIGGSSDVAGDVEVAHSLAGAIGGSSDVAGDVEVAHSLAGAITAVGSITAEILVGKLFVGAIAGMGSLNLNLHLYASLAGAVAGAGDPDGSVGVAMALAGTITGVGSISGFTPIIPRNPSLTLATRRVPTISVATIRRGTFSIRSRGLSSL